MAIKSIMALVQHLAQEDPKIWEAFKIIEESVLKKGSISLGQLSNVSTGSVGPQGPAGPAGTSLDTVATFFEYDDFLLTTPAATQFGKLDWYYNGVTSSPNPIIRETGRPGIFKITSKAPGTTFGWIINSSVFNSGAYYGGFDITDSFDVTFIIKALDIGVNAGYRIGVTRGIFSGGGAAVDPLPKPTDGCYFELLSTDTNWFAVCRTGDATETRTDTTIVGNIANWIKLRIRRIDASTIGFTIDDGTEIQIITDLPDTTHGYSLAGIVFSITNTACHLDVDYASLKITGLVR